MRYLYNKFVMLFIWWNRRGCMEGIGISDPRDRDGRFYRAAYGALGWIRKFAPHHFRRFKRSFKWIVNRRLASGTGSSYRYNELGICWIDLFRADDEMVSEAYLACYLVGESVMSRYPSKLFTNEAVKLKILRLCDAECAKFALNFNSIRHGLGDCLERAYSEITDIDRLRTANLTARDQFLLDLQHARGKGQSKH